MKLLRLLLVCAAVAVATTPLAIAAPDPAVWPLEPRPQVVRGFELPAKPWLPGHRGVDLTGSPGQPVLAATSGTVTYAGQLAGRGVVAITSGARRTTYEPVVPSLEVGTAVTPGTVIGHLSAAGSHCAPATCLHWGLLQGKQYLDPLTLLPDRPVRLLPLERTTEFATAPPQPSAQPAAHVNPDSPSRPTRTADPPGDPTATAIVTTTAALTVGAALLIRRH
jgi:murein DD-endopeptidase MepM/ murein hydrolase activator NlpD